MAADFVNRGGNLLHVVLIAQQHGVMQCDAPGAGCPTGISIGADPLLAQVTQDWLDEFERVQWLLRLSPRLRQKHGD